MIPPVLLPQFLTQIRLEFGEDLHADQPADASTIAGKNLLWAFVPHPGQDGMIRGDVSHDGLNEGCHQLSYAQGKEWVSIQLTWPVRSCTS